jgi:D-sedoheptulose 7-phosphate isomerase
VVDAIREHLERVTFSLEGVPATRCVRLLEILLESRRTGACVALAGNGGSAATAEHLAADWGRQGAMHTVGLCGCAPLLTATANDDGFENVFADQVERLLRRRDVLVLLTTSGRSPNLVTAAVAARRRGLTVVALTGTPGSPVGELAELEICAGSNVPEVVEDVHLSVGHAIARELRSRFARPRRMRPIRDVAPRGRGAGVAEVAGTRS